MPAPAPASSGPRAIRLALATVGMASILACAAIVDVGPWSGPRAGQQGRAELTSGQPIEATDRLLRSLGWNPEGDAGVDGLERELSGNHLSSLRSCSGTGVGFCRYLYRRGREHLELITVPDRNGDGLLDQWRSWTGSAEGP